MIIMAKKYVVIADNGGGVYLFTFAKKSKVDYACSGYEHNDKPFTTLLVDVDALKNGADPIAENWGMGQWDNGLVNIQEMYEEFAGDIDSMLIGIWWYLTYDDIVAKAKEEAEAGKEKMINEDKRLWEIYEQNWQ
jgi:hypothetical protein